MHYKLSEFVRNVKVSSTQGALHTRIALAGESSHPNSWIAHKFAFGCTQAVCPLLSYCKPSQNTSQTPPKPLRKMRLLMFSHKQKCSVRIRYRTRSMPPRCLLLLPTINCAHLVQVGAVLFHHLYHQLHNPGGRPVRLIPSDLLLLYGHRLGIHSGVAARARNRRHDEPDALRRSLPHARVRVRQAESVR